MRNVIATIILFCAVMLASAQTPFELVQEARRSGKPFTSVALFERALETRNDLQGTPLQHYTLLDLKSEAFQQLTAQAPAQLMLQLAFENRIFLVELVKVDAEPIRVRESQPTTAFGQDYWQGLHYRGVLQGHSGSIAAFSFAEGEVMGLISTPTYGNLVLGKVPGGESSGLHILYQDTPLLEAHHLACASDDDSAPAYLPHQLIDPLDFRNSKCARIYLEVDNDIFVNKGGTAGATAYITGLFNQVATLYANENLSIAIAEIFVWTTNSPYSGTNPATLLNQFQTLRTSFNGDLAHLVSYKPSGGIAVLSGFCHPLVIAKMGVSGIHSSFSNVPTYSWSVMVLAHELGHQFGSKHTHACAWNGNNTAIDGCAGFVEGSCPLPPLPAQGTGTIMSYCHITPVGINLSLGFGPQPGAVMRNAFAAASCLGTCTTSGGGGGGNGGGGSNPAACNANRVFLRIVLDNYPTETTWRLTNASGQIIKSGGPYLKTQAGAAIQDTFCLPNGCYTFRIFDSYSDGICCAYGNGSYTLRNAANAVIASGGQFGAEQSKNFCVSGQGSGSNCVQINFNERPIVSYGGSEDQGTFTLLNNNTVLRIQNNAWKAVMLDYTVTPNTVLQFDFASTIRGEVHGIGFDNDNIVSANYTFKLWGTQNWGLLHFNNYPGFSSWMTYTIPVGQYYTGAFNRLFFVADHDAAPGNGNSFFRNIRIYEGNSCSSLPAAEETSVAMLVEDLPDVQLFPNPAREEIQLKIHTPLSADEPLDIRILDATGRSVDVLRVDASAQQHAVPVNIRHLAPGMYVIAVQSGSFQHKVKFVKQ